MERDAQSDHRRGDACDGALTERKTTPTFVGVVRVGSRGFVSVNTLEYQWNTSLDFLPEQDTPVIEKAAKENTATAIVFYLDS